MPALILLCAAQFMVILDITVVSIAMPSIQEDLGIAVADLQWVVTAYTLAFGGLLLLGGRAADLLGRRRVFLAGLVVFTAASLAAAFAGSTAALLAARATQGVGAAMLSPAALSLVTTSFPEGPERQRALAVWAAVAAGGSAFGVLVGGVLTEALDWTAIFLVNVPIGLVVGVAALRILPRRTGSAADGHIDARGGALAVAGLVTLIYGLVEAPDAGWTSARTLGLFAAAAVALTGFVVVERRAPAPLVALGVLRRRPTATALVLMIAGMGTVLSTFFFLTLYLQHVLGHSALRTGLEFLPGAVLLVVAAHAGGHLTAAIGPRWVLAGGMSLAAVGALVLSGVSPGGSYVADVLPGLLVLDLGVGLAASAIFIVGMSGVGEGDAGMVSGLMSTAHELGGALVLPVLSTIAVTGIGAATLEAAAGVDPGLVTAGFGDAFRVAAAIALAAALLALTSLRRTDIAPEASHAMAH